LHLGTTRAHGASGVQYQRAREDRSSPGFARRTFRAPRVWPEGTLSSPSEIRMNGAAIASAPSRIATIAGEPARVELEDSERVLWKCGLEARCEAIKPP
jgi:hypothetical protein